MEKNNKELSEIFAELKKELPPSLPDEVKEGIIGGFVDLLSQ